MTTSNGNGCGAIEAVAAARTELHQEHYLAGTSAKDIAKEDGCSCSEIRRILRSSLERLRQLAITTTAAMANTAATTV